MAPRPLLPADDLYARLELPVDASFEAVEIAWRALLKRHHPDIAGPSTDELAKRINVAHDWLSDPGLRARYDGERHPHRGAFVAPGVRQPPRHPRAAGRATVRTTQPVRHPIAPAEALERHIDRIRRLSEDELDRLSLAETAPIAFIATISRFLPADRQEVLRSLDSRVTQALPRRSRWDPPTRDAVIGYAQEIVLGPFLDDHLSEPFRERVRERLTRGWEAAMDQPRYGPNTAAVRDAIHRLGSLPLAERGLMASDVSRATVPAELPWPRGLSPNEDDALRVSSALAQRDAIALLPVQVTALARRSLGRAMHGLVLRHAFKQAELERLAGPWRPIVLPPQPGTPAARRR
jgi:DnaJ-like protein